VLTVSGPCLVADAAGTVPRRRGVKNNGGRVVKQFEPINYQQNHGLGNDDDDDDDDGDDKTIIVI